MHRVVIVGAGLAGARCAETLRARGFDGAIQLVGDEPFPPYERPALSKALLTGGVGVGATRLRSPTWWAEAGIQLLLSRRVVRVDPARRVAVLRGGEELPWNTLVLATGAAARELPHLAAVRGVHRLRSLQNALALRRALRSSRRLLVVGAGFVGTEVASAAVSLGVDVTLVDPLAPLSRVLGDEVSAVLTRRYRNHGVDVRIGVGIDGVEAPRGNLRAARLTDESRLACDLILAAVGVAPAPVQGVPAGANGVTTDAAGRTGIQGVYACGDVAEAWHPLLCRNLRVEHWADAAAQGAAVAHAILGAPAPPRQLPFFWSDQFGLRLQYVGHGSGWRTVELQGAGESFTAVYRDDAGRRLAALVANRPQELGELRKTLLADLPTAA